MDQIKPLVYDLGNLPNFRIRDAKSPENTSGDEVNGM